MSSITSEDVQVIAALARLGLSGAEVERATADLVSVLEHFSRLQAIGTAHVEAASNMTGLKNIMREDKAETSVLCSAADLLSRAHADSSRFVKAPSVRL